MAKKSIKSGLFITFEGCEGSGKSTQAKLLAARLKRDGYRVLLTREPGGTKLGERIRALLLNACAIPLSRTAELLLFEAARAQIVEEVIAPALAEGAIVISDRFNDATMAYQGYGAGVDRRIIAGVDRVATGPVRPDLTILLDIPTRLGLHRATRSGRDRMESRATAYHERVRKGYLAIARRERKRFRVFDAIGPKERIECGVAAEVRDFIRTYRRKR